jgi:hypothetical protein
MYNLVEVRLEMTKYRPFPFTLYCEQRAEKITRTLLYQRHPPSASRHRSPITYCNVHHNILCTVIFLLTLLGQLRNQDEVHRQQETGMAFRCQIRGNLPYLAVYNMCETTG